MSEKLQKVLAARGIGSRREMERWISAGRVSVNGCIAKLGDRVEATDKLIVDGKQLPGDSQAVQRQRIILYNKPEGEITSRKDGEGRDTVFNNLPPLKNQRWISVGRLDYNTSGLLLFTTDGELANKLMHPSTAIEREYICRVMGEVDAEVVKRLLQGVQLEDGPARFSRIEEREGQGINRWFAVTLHEGRNREVRRLWESQGFMVNRLKRIRFGRVVIPPYVTPGNWLELDRSATKELYQSAGLKAARPVPLSVAEKESQQRHEARLRQRGRGGSRQ